MAVIPHEPGEVAASAAMVSDLLGHLTVTTQQIHRAVAGPVQHPVDHCAVIGPLPTGLAIDRQQRLDLRPLRVGQLVSSDHARCVPAQALIYPAQQDPSETP